MSEQFQASQLALANSNGNRFPYINQAAKTAFAKAQFPTRKTESWKYTPLRLLTQGLYDQTVTTLDKHEHLSDVADVPDLNSQRLVFVNGLLSTELSSPQAITQVTLFSQADEHQQAVINDHLDNIATDNRHLFNELNSAQLSDGVLLHIKKNEMPEQVIQISWLTTPQAANFSVNTRLLIVLEQGAQATVLEHYASDNTAQNSFTNAVTEASIGDNAKLQHYRLQLMQEDALHIGATHVNLARDANYHAFHLGLGSKLTRNDLVVNHNTGGSHAEISGIYVPQNEQLIDFHTCIEHKVAHCTSNEVFRGIMDGRSKAVFNGRIHIHPHAQKTLAELSNKNLLLTRGAEVNTKPELEIYADDVKCAHGATVAQLEDSALFYMQSRGISKQQARMMLSFGFINELLDELPHQAISDYLRPLLQQRFQQTATKQDIAEHTS